MEPATFDRTNPCTKVHIFNCFKKFKAGTAVPVVEAHTIIGVNTPKYLLKKGFIRTTSIGGKDLYVLSQEGAEWLQTGLKRHLELHPSDADKLTTPLLVTPPAIKPRIVRRR